MIELRSPNLELVPSYLDFVEEMSQCGEKIWETWLPAPTETHEAFVSRLLQSATHAQPGLVTDETYWATQDQQVVGRISLRHELNDNLKEFGGHIGYEVLPSKRRNGIAKSMLKKVLETPKAKEIGRLLLTCAPDNVASNRTILANGGVLEKTAYVKKINRDTNYYWIEV